MLCRAICRIRTCDGDFIHSGVAVRYLRPLGYKTAYKIILISLYTIFETHSSLNY